MINLLWLIIDIPLFTLLLFFLSNNLIFIFLTIALLNILIGVSVSKTVFNRDLRGSLEFTSISQSIFGAVFILINASLVFFLILNNIEEMEGSVLTFFISAAVILGFTIIFVYWGDKIQLIGFQRLIALISILPGLIYITNAFFTQHKAFFDNFVPIIIVGLIYSIVSGIILKTISYTTISFQKIRELTVLEKAKTLLQVENLKVHYPLIGGFLKRQIGAVKAVNGISFDIKTWETVGLVGESGCGKTTVAKAILGLVNKEEGTIYFNGEPIPEVYNSYLRQKIQIVFQDPDASLNPRMKVVDIISEPLRNLLGITKKKELRKHVLRLMEEVSLKREHLDRYPHEFSGGQKQRIIIARALACNPELIILDEPTSALDVSVQAQILNLLKNLQKTYGYGFLFITHNLAVVSHIAERVAVMYLGKFVEIGNTSQIFTNPSHPYTQALLASRSEIDPYNQDISFVIEGEVPSPINPPPGCPFNPRCSSETRTEECEYKSAEKIKIEDNHYIWCVNPLKGVNILEETGYVDDMVGEVPFGTPKKRFKNTIKLALLSAAFVVVFLFIIPFFYGPIHNIIYITIGGFWFIFQCVAIYMDYFDYERHLTKYIEVGLIGWLLGGWHVNARYWYILNAIFPLVLLFVFDLIFLFTFAAVDLFTFLNPTVILWGISSLINLYAGIRAIPPENFKKKMNPKV